MKTKKTIIIATIKNWNIERYHSWHPPEGYTSYLIDSPEELTLANIQKINPEYIFFPHWSTIIPQEIFNNVNCIVFHMTDLPFGRGGSPLQNLIVRGIYTTKVSALKVDAGIDTGPIYLKKDFDISHGSAEELYKDLSRTSFKMISEILETSPLPQQQEGNVTSFKRRTSDESAIPQDIHGQQLYDFIRMLDAPGYPKAFISTPTNTLIFSEAKLNDNNSVEATTTFKLITK